MAVVLQLLVISIVGYGLYWAVVGDLRSARAKEADTPSTMPPMPRRRPWCSYALLTVSAGLFLAGAMSAMQALGWVEAEAEGTPISLAMVLLVMCGVALGGYALLDKYPIHPGQPPQTVHRVRWLRNAFLAGFFLLPTASFLYVVASHLPPELSGSDSGSGGGTTGVPVRFVDRSGRYLVEAAAAWRENPQLAGQACAMGISDLARDLHLAVVIESKGDFVQPDLQAYATLWASRFPQAMDDWQMTAWKATSVGGWPAVQCEAHGALNNVRLAYLLTCVETGDHFCGIQAWSTSSRFEESRAELEAITATFQEAEPAKPQ